MTFLTLVVTPSRPSVMTTATGLLLFLLIGVSVADSDMDDSDVDSDDSCLPALADRCFKYVLPSFNCHLENKGVCSEYNDICSVLAEALQCASDIIDTDCRPEEGQRNFDSWLRGLRAVHSRICSTLQDLLSVFYQGHSPCFNIEDFLGCVEYVTRVTHIVDFLHVILNVNECNRILIALTTCNVRASVPYRSCEISQDALNDIIFTFFNNSDCGQAVCACPSNTTQGTPRLPCSNAHSNSPATSLPSCVYLLSMLTLGLVSWL